MKMDQLGRLMLSCNGAIFLHLSAKMSPPLPPRQNNDGESHIIHDC